MSYEQVIVADWQAAAAPYKNRAIVVCSGKGQDPTLVKPAIRACRSEGTERAHCVSPIFLLRALAAWEMLRQRKS